MLVGVRRVCGDGFGAPHLSVGEGGGAAKGWMWAGWGLSVLGMQEPKGNLQEKGRRRNSEGKEGGRMHCHRCPAPWRGTEQEVCTHIKHQGEHGEWDEHSWKFAGCWEWDTRSTWGSPAMPCSRLPPPCTESAHRTARALLHWVMRARAVIYQSKERVAKQNTATKQFGVPKKRTNYRPGGGRKRVKNKKKPLWISLHKKETPTHKQNMNMGNGYGYFGEQKWY